MKTRFRGLFIPKKRRNMYKTIIKARIKPRRAFTRTIDDVKKRAKNRVKKKRKTAPVLSGSTKNTIM